MVFKFKHKNKKKQKKVNLSKAAFIKIVLSLLLFASFTIFILFLHGQGNKHKFVVVLDQRGFEPYKIVIHKGDTVDFVNYSGKYFWPASDIHPTHQIYPQFDPKRAFGPNQDWSFKFDRVGAWPYHDHLFIYYTGVVVVLDKNKNSLDPNYSCKKTSDQNMLACWEEMIQVALEQKGIQGAFNLLDKLYHTQPVFAKNCHDYAHWIGQYSYIYYYSKTGKLNLTKDATICGNGFYHGFMETFVRVNPDPAASRKFCEYVRKQVGNASADSCYHGIGHGLIGLDPNTWGNELLSAKDSLRRCEQITSNKNNLANCESGVFANIATYEATGEYSLKINKKNPLLLCFELADKYKQTCFQGMRIALDYVYNGNIDKEIAYILNIKNKQYQTYLIQAIAGDEMYQTIGHWNFDKEIQRCQALPDYLYHYCLDSFIGQVIEISGAADGVNEGNIFCSSDMLSAADKNYCLGIVKQSVYN